MGKPQRPPRVGRVRDEGTGDARTFTGTTHEVHRAQRREQTYTCRGRGNWQHPNAQETPTRRIRPADSNTPTPAKKLLTRRQPNNTQINRATRPGNNCVDISPNQSVYRTTTINRVLRSADSYADLPRERCTRRDTCVADTTHMNRWEARPFSRTGYDKPNPRLHLRTTD